jgi:hypothetical protein
VWVWEGREANIWAVINNTRVLIFKAGTTFWKRIFFFLYNQTGGGNTSKNVTSPMDLERLYVHHHYGLGSDATASMTSQKGGELLMSTTRVMFTRDPWSRLWSA